MALLARRPGRKAHRVSLRTFRFWASRASPVCFGVCWRFFVRMGKGHQVLLHFALRKKFMVERISREADAGLRRRGACRRMDFGAARALVYPVPQASGRSEIFRVCAGGLGRPRACTSETQFCFHTEICPVPLECMDKIRQVLFTKCMTQRLLAKRAKSNEATISNVLNGVRQLGPTLPARIAAALEIPPAELFKFRR